MAWKLDKTREEWDRFRAAIRWPRDRGDITHAYVNVFVEAFRWMPYTLGHIVALVPPAWLAYVMLN